MFSSKEIGTSLVVLNDFWSSSIWAIKIQVLFNEFENLKNSGIQPKYESYHMMV